MKTNASFSPDAELRRWHARLNVTAEAVAMLLSGVFGEHRPADRLMSAFFREHQRCGSQDRRFTSNSCYALLRYWGWLRKLLPADRLERLERGAEHFSRREFSGLLLAALLIDGREHAAARCLASELGIVWPEENAGGGDVVSLTERVRAVAAAFGRSDLSFALSDLVPAALLELLPPDLDRDKFLAQLPLRPPMWLRLQSRDREAVLAALRSAELALEVHPRIPFAVAVRDARINLFTLESYRQGDFEVQDLASMAIGLCAAPRKRERWLDCCAGAGGKTLLLAELMQRTGTVVASDVRAYKLDDLRTRARRAGFPNIQTRPWDGKPLTGRLKESFDGVLVDAPCSCSGVWRRNPESRWTLTRESLAEFPPIQRQVLAAAAPAVRPGGVLIYATCSIFPAEDEEVVNAFLAEHDDFVLEDFIHPLTGETCRGMSRFCGVDDDCDSMFAARLRRKEKV